MLARVFAVAVAVNYPWELAQAPLYAPPMGWGARLWHCGLASVGDGAMVLLIVVAGRLLLRRGDWFVRPGTRDRLVMLALGLALSVGVEWVALRGLGWWAYAPGMPLVPVLGVGVAPLLQMLALPPLIAHFATCASRAGAARR